MADIFPDIAIYKILTPAQWAALQEDGVYALSPVDARDGFVHFSRLGQVRETVARHFTDAATLIIAEIATAPLIEALKWEAGRSEELFPHLYGTFEREHIRRYWRIERQDNGWTWPDEFRAA